MMGIEPRFPCMLEKCSTTTTELYASSRLVKVFYVYWLNRRSQKYKIDYNWIWLQEKCKFYLSISDALLGVNLPLICVSPPYLCPFYPTHLPTHACEDPSDRRNIRGLCSFIQNKPWYTWERSGGIYGLSYKVLHFTSYQRNTFDCETFPLLIS